ncbi:MAG: hypothetical protein ACRDFB_04325, partial [Rhabdochlamydiaceae bacterium]
DCIDHDDIPLVPQETTNNTAVSEDEEFFDASDEDFDKIMLSQGAVDQKEPESTDSVENKQESTLSKWIPWADKVAAFSRSIVGSKLIQTGKAVIGENVGMLVGAAFPEASIAYAVGTAAANSALGDSEKKSKIVQGAGIVAALTVTALTTSLSYMTGTPMEYGQALGYMVTAAGTIAGGMNGLQAMGQQVPDNYIPRTAAYLATTGVVGGAVSSIRSLPLPGAVSTAIGVGGGVLKTVAGTASYYAPEAAMLADKIIRQGPHLENLYDPGTFAQNVATHANGDTSAFSASIASNYIESPFFSSLVQRLLTRTINKKAATNAIVKGLNDFVVVMQDKDIQQKINEFKASPDQAKKDLLQQAISQLVEKKYGMIERGIANMIRKKSDPQIPGLVQQIVEMMSKKETEFFGMELSNSTQIKNLLEIMLPSLIPLIGIYAKRELISSQELPTEEIEKFYQNVNEVIFAPYNEYWLARGVQGLISTAIPVMQQKAQFIPALLSEKLGQSMVDPLIALDDEKEFDISKSSPKEKGASEESTPKKTFWRSIRQKIRTIKYLIQFVGFKKFYQIAWKSIMSYFMNKPSNQSSMEAVLMELRARKKTDTTKTN